MWVLAGLWHEIAAIAFYASVDRAEHQGLGIILAAYLFLGVAMAAVYPVVRMSGRTALDGLVLGAAFGVIWVLPHGLVMAAAHGESLSYEFINAGWHVIEQGIGGLVVTTAYTALIHRLNFTS